jgi:hypothetical protein
MDRTNDVVKRTASPLVGAEIRHLRGHLGAIWNFLLLGSRATFRVPSPPFVRS